MTIAILGDIKWWGTDILINSTAEQFNKLWINEKEMK